MDLRPQFRADRTTALVLLGDALCIALFSAAGALQHPGNAPLYARVPEIAAPFVLGWLLVGALVGTFDGSWFGSARTAAGRAAVAWLGADIVGQALRATAFVPGGADPAFFVVSLLVGGALLVGWRALVARTL
ncbi:DUF3054 domain-containing protein [Halosegnis marinus]|uniref:DUF3054 domain-containing protein n=1 Tax=Halosegnis marinus TaxID=3034023 RepID=A0ABD5ZRZ0_9EURY|nr:DUF3054 domain-containing protein [Halosegnis sp. DT85]